MFNDRLILQGEKRNLIILNDDSENYRAFIRWIEDLKHFTYFQECNVFFFPDDKYITQCSVKARKLGLIIT